MTPPTYEEFTSHIFNILKDINTDKCVPNFNFLIRVETATQIFKNKIK